MLGVLLYSDTWGDHLRVTLHRRLLLLYVLTVRFGAHRTRHWYLLDRDAADGAYDAAVGNLDLIVQAITNGIPEHQTWPPF